MNELHHRDQVLHALNDTAKYLKLEKFTAGGDHPLLYQVLDQFNNQKLRERDERVGSPDLTKFNSTTPTHQELVKTLTNSLNIFLLNILRHHLAVNHPIDELEQRVDSMIIN